MVSVPVLKDCMNSGRDFTFLLVRNGKTRYNVSVYAG